MRLSAPHALLALLLLLTLTIPATAPVPAYAASTAEPIVIFGNSTKPPKSWLDEGHPKGILVDILREVERRTGLVFDIRLMPWKRAYMNALDGRGGIFGLSRNRERLSLFDFSEVQYVEELRLVVMDDKVFSYRTMEDLRGKVLGVTRGASYGDAFDRAKGKIFTPSEDSSPVCRLRMLLAGRIDAALIGPGEAALHFNLTQDKKLAEHRDRFVMLDTPFARDDNYIGFAKSMRRTETLGRINRALREMQRDGAIERIEARY